MWSITFKKIGPIDAFHRIRLTLGDVGAYATLEFMPTMGRYISKLVLLGHHRTHAGPLRAPYGHHMGRYGFLRHTGPLIKLAWVAP